MKKSELLAKIAALEARIATLEARPLYVHQQPQFLQTPGPNYYSPTILPQPAWPNYPVVTCGAAQ